MATSEFIGRVAARAIQRWHLRPMERSKAALLPTIGYAGGNVRELGLEEIWNSSSEIHFGRLRSVDDLWGFCRSCYYADVCRGGCTWTSHSLSGHLGNNPYCHYERLN